METKFNYNGWMENKVVIKIQKLKKEYHQIHMYAGCSTGFGETEMNDLFLCEACGTLTKTLESKVHKKDQSKSIGICPGCSNIWGILKDVQQL